MLINLKEVLNLLIKSPVQRATALGVRVDAKIYQQYRERRTRNDLVLISVDNARTRWDVQLDFPRVILNDGMYANSFTVSRHDDFLGKACLGCLYPSSSSEVRPPNPYPAISFISMFVGSLLAGEILKERIERLQRYRMDNAFIVNDLFATPRIGETYLSGRLFEKSDNCGCYYRSPEVIRKYKKS